MVATLGLELGTSALWLAWSVRHLEDITEDVVRSWVENQDHPECQDWPPRH